MNCVIDTGGGSKGIYGAGVFDCFLDLGLHFDVLIGVSAGSANAVTFMAGQKERTKSFYLDYAFRKNYMSLENVIKNRSYINLDYIYRRLSNSYGENPLDYKKMSEYNGEIYITATCAETGKARYFTKKDIYPDDYSVLCASCSIPGVGKPYNIDGMNYFDGGVSDPIPIEKALALGCDKITLIITRPLDEIPDGKPELVSSGLIFKNYPDTAKALLRRKEKYAKSLMLAKQLEKEGKCTIISPDNTCGISTLTKNREGLVKLYLKGYSDAEKSAANILNYGYK